MTTLLRYLFRLSALRVLAALLALSALLQLFDLLDRAGEVLERGSGLGDLVQYAALRLPLIVERLVPLALLVGISLTLLSLARSNEIIAMRSAGLTLYRLLAMLMPVALIAAAAHFVLMNQIAPRAERSFLAWWETLAPESDRDDGREPIWIRDGSRIVSIGSVEAGGAVLDAIAIYQRDAEGRITGRVRADRAAYDGGEWTLHDVRRTVVRQGAPEREALPRMRWETRLTPSNIVAVAEPTEYIPAMILRDIVAGTRAGANSPAYYRTKLYKAYADPLASPIMILLAVPAAAGVQRQRTMGAGLALSLVMGLLYLLAVGLLSALGEAGLVPPALAAWAPHLIFASLGAAILLHVEG